MAAEAVTGSTAADSDEPQLAPFVLLRVAGLPFVTLLDLAPPAMSAIVDTALEASATMEALRPRCTDALHAAVPGADRATRRAALTLKRDVHNGRAPLVAPDALLAVQRALEPDARKALADWLAASERLDGCVATAERQHRALCGHVRARLRALIDQEELRRPLALVAPALLAHADRERSSPTPLSPTKVERSLLAFLMRAAAKTSPLSTFMHLAVLDPQPAPHALPSLDHVARTSRTVLNRGLVFQLRTAALGCCGDWTHAAFVRNPTVTWVPGGAHSMASTVGTLDGRILRLSRPAGLRMAPALAARLARLPDRFGWPDLMDALIGAGLSSAEATATGERLWRGDIISLAPWTDAFQSRPAVTGREALDRCPSPAGRTLGVALDAMDQRARRVSGAGSDERRPLLDRIATTAAAAEATVGADAGPLASTLVLEDAYFRAPAGSIGSPIRSLLDEVASVVRLRVGRRAHDIAIRDLFVELFGEAGTCHDAVAFLCRAAEELPQRCPVDAVIPATRAGLARAGQRVGATVLVQLSATSEAALTSGDGLAVLNAIHAGCGWLSARHAMGDDEFHAALRDGLRRWIAALTAPAEPVDLLVSGDCNELQAHPRLTDRVLACPLEPVLGRGALSWRDLTLRHQPETDAIAIHAHGSPVVPIYLGATFPHPGWGATYWLTVLATPWRADALAPPKSPDTRHADVVSAARETVGRIVLRRATWWIATARLRRVWLRHTGARRVLDTALDCARLGLPERFFVRAHGAARTAPTAKHRKPLWIDTRNPFLLDVLERLVGDADQLCITEPLPDVPHWPRLRNGPHASELQVELALEASRR